MRIYSNDGCSADLDVVDIFNIVGMGRDDRWHELKGKMREYYNKEKDPKKAACWLKVIKVMNSMDGTFGGKK